MHTIAINFYFGIMHRFVHVCGAAIVVVEVEREKEYRVKWQDKVEEWKQLMQQIAEGQFRYIHLYTTSAKYT